jgi:hypothetical protein
MTLFNMDLYPYRDKKTIEEKPLYVLHKWFLEPVLENGLTLRSAAKSHGNTFYCREKLAKI